MKSIDGSLGEGGGQILRTAVSLSAALGRNVEVFNIRANRPNPGLRPQHFWALKALAQVFDATVDGLTQDSTRIEFKPNRTKADERILNLDLGTAGSITLLLQAIIQAVSTSRKTLRLSVGGGTDVKWSPTIDYFRSIVLPVYEVMGVEVDLEVKRRGFFPKGGGRVECTIRPRSKISSIDFRHDVYGPTKISSICSGLSVTVAERQARSASNFLQANGIEVEKIEYGMEEAYSSGTALCIFSLMDRDTYLGADGFGERRKRAEEVGEETALRFLKERTSNTSLDHHLADMVVPLLSLAEGNSRFTTSSISQHLTTNLRIAEEVAGTKSQIRKISENRFEVVVNP